MTDQKKKRVLVIDDDVEVRSMICANLADCGYNVDCAGDGEEGLRLLQRQTPRLVITDVIMPSRDGMEVILEIRKHYPGVKVLAISGGGRSQQGDYLGMAERLGCHAILRKPLNMAELEETVETLIV